MTTGNNINSPFFHEDKHKGLEQVRATPITICGVGSLGGPITESLARMGYSHLTIIDNGRVEARNLSCQPYTTDDARGSTYKTRTLATSLYRAVRAKVIPLVAILDEKNSESLLKDASLVIDAFDNHAARLAVSESANLMKIACLHVGFSGDGLYGSGIWEPGYRVPQENSLDPCDYPLTRPFAQVVAALACRVIGEYLLEGIRQNFEVTWNDLHITLR